MVRSLYWLFIVSLSLMVVDAKANPAQVIVSKVRLVPFVDDVEALGTLRANESVDIMSTVTDRIIELSFSDGERVKKGSVLVRMDASEEQALLAEEQARLEEAQKQVKRLAPLADLNAATQSTLDEERREVQMAQARIEGIKSRIAERKIRAPFDGVVGLRRMSVGAIAQPGLVLATIDDDDTMKLDFPIPEIFVGEITPGLKITALTKAYQQQEFTGVVESIDSRIDPVTRSVVIRALIDNTEHKLKPGLLMRVALKVNPRKTLVIPEETLLSSSTRNFVYRIVEGEGKTSVERIEVNLGVRRKGEVEVLAGLAEGDRLVVHGVNRIKPGQEVVIRAEEKANESLKQMLDASGSSS